MLPTIYFETWPKGESALEKHRNYDFFFCTNWRVVYWLVTISFDFIQFGNLLFQTSTFLCWSDFYEIITRVGFPFNYLELKKFKEMLIVLSIFPYFMFCRFPPPPHFMQVIILWVAYLFILPIIVNMVLTKLWK